MLNAKICSDIFPTSLRPSLESFSGSKLVKVKRRKMFQGRYGRKGNCHFNVEQLIKRKGGSHQFGWKLINDKTCHELGMYVWTYHSIWITEGGYAFDVTEDSERNRDRYSVFMADDSRDADLEEGIFYNNFVVFDEPCFAAHYARAIRRDIRIHTPYWCDPSIKILLEIENHSGKYRSLYPSSRYRHNIDRFGTEFNCDVKEGQLIPRKGATLDQKVPHTILFDYNIALAE